MEEGLKTTQKYGGKMKLGGVQDSVPMQAPTISKTRKPKITKGINKAKVGMAVTNVAVKRNPPVGKRHNATHTGYVSVTQKRKGGSTKRK
jgi:hypothetical protein